MPYVSSGVLRDALEKALSCRPWGIVQRLEVADTRGGCCRGCRFHSLLVQLFKKMQESEALQPDYDSYSAVIKSYLKEAVCGFRQFSPSHPGALPPLC